MVSSKYFIVPLFLKTIEIGGGRAAGKEGWCCVWF